jgi:hypothetical protein
LIAASSLHLKEDRGGLREIDLLLAAQKARLGVWETPGEDPFLYLARLDPQRAPLYTRLSQANDLLVAVRSAYRVAVAATATIEQSYLAAPARILGYVAREGVGAGARLFGDVRNALEQSAQTVDQLLGIEHSAGQA